MHSTIRLPHELGRELTSRRNEAGLTIKELARRAGKSRAVIYRLERGEESSLTSLLAVTAALGLSLRLDAAELPTLEETRDFFSDDEDDEEGPNHAS